MNSKWKEELDIIILSVWKLINFFYWTIIIASVIVGIRTIIFFMEGMKDDQISVKGLTYVWTAMIGLDYFQKSSEICS